MLLIKLSIKNEENLTTNLFEPLIKENIKYVQFNQIKGSTKTRAKQKELVMKLKYEQNFIARFCHNCILLEVSFRQHEKFQINLSL